MIDGDRLEQRYSELCESLGDPRSRQVVDDLDRAYSIRPPISAQGALEAALRERVVEFERARPEGARNMIGGRAVRRGRRRLLPVLAACLALAVLAAGIPLGATRTAQQSVADSGSAWPALLASQGTPIGASIAMCGYRLTVDRAYVDANLILVAYHTTAPKGQAIDNIGADVALQGARSHPYRGISGFGLPPSGRGEFPMIQSFDASGIARSSRLVSLNFVLGSLRAFLSPASAAVLPASCLRHGPIGANERWIMSAEPKQANGQQTVVTVRPPKLHSPAHLTFSVPYVPRSRVATINAVVHVGSSWLEVVRVVVTPAETRLYLRGKIDEIFPTRFEAGGQYYGIDVQGLTDAGLTADSYIFNLYDKQGEWLVAFPPAHRGGADQLVRFSLPAPAPLGTPVPAAFPSHGHTPVGIPRPMP